MHGQLFKEKGLGQNDIAKGQLVDKGIDVVEFIRVDQSTYEAEVRKSKVGGGGRESKKWVK